MTTEETLLNNFRSAKPRRKCAFCDSDRNITKEHFWPRWLDSVLPPRTSEDTNTQSIIRIAYGIDEAGIVIDRSYRTRPGNPRTRKVRFVCRNCNLGWMNSLQLKANDILVPMIVGGDINLTKSEQEVIAKWATMTCMSAEFTDISSISIPDWQRYAFRLDQSLIPGWYIWIGRYEGIQWWNTRMRHIGMVSLPRTEIFSKRGQRHRYNSQTTAISFGKLLVFCLSSDDIDFISIPHDFQRNFAQVFSLLPLWPINFGSVQWRNLPILNDESVSEIADWANGLQIR